MIHFPKAALLAGLLALGAAGPGGAAAEAVVPQAVLFREGTLDALPQDHALLYRRDVDLPADAAFAAAQSGVMQLAHAPDAPGQVRLGFGPDSDHLRVLGAFPAATGNPMAMVHLETLVRDMARLTGGSQFYIRNRLKEALLRPVAAAGTQGGTEIVLHPFAGDANAARMGGFAGLEIRAVAGPSVPGWYRSLEAIAPDGSGGVLYRSVIRFEAEEALP
ncbi:hypothetical protein [Mangrovicoccus algicola]|uniref:Uncharacterized protein n=1 Tax=Mangrovicoccus algicola TaxID=2771008 RepID=A0A8J6YSW4_9RHOB|nr:hypothetical protein [Mangrovicoccus algicola]MBE3636985.1 hypothetical protein [Mangrovicoccus algicola]